ncbi:MAG TPA: Nramp family divalent metal transporter [Bacteroidia bacterium]|jgi:manganese transport protein|nr:Nramp family divalent metal transporter [Bacteroidia bacterium]
MNRASGKSLEEVHASVNTSNKNRWRSLFAFFGPAYMISVGYMDPGNWATDIAGGSKFGYSLIWVLLMSNLTALLLQSHCARLGIVTGKDLAQASRESYPPLVNLFLYALAEIAIAACDLAEVIGMAIGIHLLFPHVSLVMGVCITVLDTFVLLFLLNRGIRKLEAFIISLVLLIGVSFFIQLTIAKPDLGEVAKGIIPGIANEEALYIAIGIIGATVMPHNLYLHSSLVQTRKYKRDTAGIKRAIRFNVIDSTIALNLALFVNAAILILAAASFYSKGLNDVSEIQDAHRLLEPMLGSTLAPILFAVALIAAGQSSTITGTLAGQVVMEGYLNLRLQPWIRRLLTRLVAIVPALLVILIIGESSTGKLLILSQVILSLQLGFAIIPLIHFVSDKNKMREFVIPVWQKILSWIAAIIIIGLNVKMVFNELAAWITSSDHTILISFTVVPLSLFCALMLLYIIVVPFIRKRDSDKIAKFHGDYIPIIFSEDIQYNTIAISVDFSSSDNKAINKAIGLGGTKAEYLLVHILESANAVVYGEDAFDMEREQDYQFLKQHAEQLNERGFRCKIALGYGNPKTAIPALVLKNNCDILVMGTHGHKTFKDILLGTTIEGVRHNIKIPLVLV